MKTAAASCHPDFPGHCVAIDNDLAAIVKLDFQNPPGRQLKIEILGLKCCLDRKSVV